MKKIIYTLFTLLSVVYFAASAKEITGNEAQRKITGAEKIRTSEYSSIPEFVKFREESQIKFSVFEKWAHSHFNLAASSAFKLLSKTNDKAGYTHYRYQQTINGIPVEGTMYIVHVKNNLITSMNGLLFDKLKVSLTASIEKSSALNVALKYMNASVYRWQVPGWEQQIKEVKNDPTATWYPKGELVYASEKGIPKSENYRLCYKFDVYAQEPLDRKYVFVDAATGKVIHTINRIENSDAIGTAVTAYSGNHTITTDSVNATTFHLKETARGLGIETYNLQGGMNYVNTNFVDADNFWDNVNPQLDQYAGDAHWGAEMTYDFYWNNFGRNSIDDAGFKLVSYVHFGNNFVNAFWDGQEMTYGDGDNTYTPLTSLDVAGHEISHGLTALTSGLGNVPEGGAMNEGFSDCMGNAIRQYGKQSATIDWLIGDELGGAPFRDMQDPNSTSNPDTYLGLYWDLGQEVHQNSTVFSHAFYLVSEGGSGTNDNNNVYTVNAMGLDTASAIWFRMNTVYLTPNSAYQDARYYAIQAAIDLYGPCTAPVIETTNAWYAVGIGGPFVMAVVSDFSAPVNTFCQLGDTVHFTNSSTNAGSYTWYFGDGATSTAINPTHVYATWGNYDVKLVADGGPCGIDSNTKAGYISIDSLNPCVIVLPNNGTATTQTSCAGQLFDSGGPAANYGDNTDATITISPLGASIVTLTFTMFDMEDTFDFLYIYDGPTTASPLIGAYTGATLPNGGTIVSTGGSITLRQTSDVFVNNPGFAMTWQCTLSTVPPTANFIASDTLSCTGNINFTDQSTNGPTSWTWDFGDLTATSPLQNPSHTYIANGTYTVTLTASNSNGTDSLTKTSYITVNKPAAPTGVDDTICAGQSANLFAAGTDSLTWFTAPTGGTPVFTGANYITPPVNVNTTFYVETEVFPAVQSVGPIDNTFGTGTIYNNNNYHDLVFDCYAPVTLVSVQVYAQGTNNRTITLTDNGGNILQSATINIPDGPSVVTLNFPIPVGTNLELGCQGTVDLFRNQSGAAFPYTLAGVISITGTNVFDPGYYYYFYNWQLVGPPCTSARTPVNVFVNASPTAAFTSSNVNETYTFTDNSVGATSWFWDFGDGNNTTGQGPVVHTYTATGTYIVMLIVNNGLCIDTAFQTVVITLVGIEQHENYASLTIYPNPATNEINLSWNQTEQETISINITDHLGRVVFDESNQLMKTGIHSERISLTGFADGIYFLELKGENSNIVKKITVMN